MARKGQKFKKYTAVVKEEVLKKYFSGRYTAKMLGEEYDIPKFTVKTWIRRYKQGEQVLHDARSEKSGREKEAEIDYKERYEILKKYQAFIEARREKK